MLHMTDIPEDATQLQLQPAQPGEETIKVRVTPTEEPLLREMFEESGFSTSTMIEASATGQLAIFGISALAAGGGFPGLARVLAAYLARDQHRKVIVQRGDE